METGGLLARAPSPADGRAEHLSLTPQGQAVYVRLGQRALAFDADLRARLGPEIAAKLDASLREIIAASAPAAPEGD
jgi:DNA-binding MarR family transcriptional regulator